LPLSPIDRLLCVWDQERFSHNVQSAAHNVSFGRRRINVDLTAESTRILNDSHVSKTKNKLPDSVDYGGVAQLL